MMLFKDVRVKDVNGDEVDLNDLMSRLRYRQDRRRKLGIPVDETLNIITCWNNHVFFDKLTADKCRECEGKIRFTVKEGVLHE